MKKIFIIIFVFISSHISAQEIEWQNTIGGSGLDYISSVIQTTDGGYLIGGYSKSNISGDKTENCIGLFDYWILKLDSVGTIQWQKTIGGYDNDILKKVIQTNDGGYLLGGYSSSDISGDKSENSNGVLDYWLVKIDSVGTIQWQNTIGGLLDDYLSTVIQTSDGGYLAGGYSRSNISGDKTENSFGINDYWIVKLNFAGNIQWQNTIGGANQDKLYSLIQTIDDGYLIGGGSDSPISGDKTVNTNGYDDYWMVKVSSTGTIQWQKSIGGNEDDILFSIIQTSDAGYMLGGSSMSGISGDKTENSFGLDDCWIVKTDSAGIIEWEKTLGGNYTEQLFSLTQTPDGGYFLGGSSNSEISGNKDENSNGLYDYWIIKTDSVGAILWQNTIGGHDQDNLQSIIPTFDNSYLLGGTSSSSITGDKTENLLGQLDYWVVKITENYNLIQGTSFADLNSNQLQDPGDPAFNYQKITETNSNRFAFSQPSGFYSLAVLDTGNFEVIPDYLNLYTSVPMLHSGNFTAIQQIDSLNDFAFQPTGTFNDLCLDITPMDPFRSGFNSNYSLNYSNLGTTGLIPTIVFYPDSNVSFISASIAPTTVTSDSVIFALSNLTPFQTGNIFITVSVDSGLPIGTLINSGALILPILNDVNPGCNSSYWEVFTSNSYDPNDILVNRSFLYDYEMTSPPDLEYIIRFQNTGNDTALTVKVLNPIDTSRLQLSTIEIVSSSHSASVSWIPWERNIQFLFNNILLPDSNSNQIQSHGFLRYKIKPKTNLLAGDSIANQAYIYFDFNNPVATNIAETDIILFAGVHESQTSSELLNIFPNPANSTLNIQFNPGLQKKISLELFDVYGHIIKIIQEVNISSDSLLKTIDISDLSSGVYFVKFSGEYDAVKKFVKY